MDTNVSGLWRFYKETVVLLLSPGRAAAKRDALYSNSIFLIANAGAGAVLGFGFWVVAARLYPVEAVGVGTALLSAGGLLVFIATFGFGQGLIRYLHTSPSNASSLINSCYTLSGIAAIAASLIFIAGIPLWSPALDFVRSDVRIVLLFVIFVLSNTLFSLLNDTYLAFRRTDYTFGQGISMSLLKFILVIAFTGFPAVFSILASCTLAILLMVLLGLYFSLRKLLPGYRALPVLYLRNNGEMIRFSFINFVSLGIGLIPGAILPIMVLNEVSSKANAYFFMAWSFAGLLFAIPSATANSLFAEGSHGENNFAGNIKRSLQLIAVLAIPAALILAAAGNKLLLVFGKQYSEESTKLLWFLVPTILPLSLNVVYIAAAKVKKRMDEVIAINSMTSVGTLSLAYFLLPRIGIIGAGAAWLATQTIVALILLPRFIRLLKEKGTAVPAA